MRAWLPIELCNHFWLLAYRRLSRRCNGTHRIMQPFLVVGLQALEQTLYWRKHDRMTSSTLRSTECRIIFDGVNLLLQVEQMMALESTGCTIFLDGARAQHILITFHVL